MKEEKLSLYKTKKRKLKRKPLKLNLQSLLFIFLINSISNELYSEIHLIISGIGVQEVLNHEFNPGHIEVFVNGVKNSSCTLSCYMEEDTNSITLRFYDQIVSCKNMFNSLRNLVEIDLSDFDSSQVTDMELMFYGCSSLKKANFGIINTSSLEKMNNLFRECSALTTVNLLNIDTSKVKTMEYLFYGCTQLKSIDISNFDLSKVNK